MNTQTEDLQKNSPNPFYLMFESIGVVYGDIGTSVLYAFKEALKTTTMNHTLLVERTEVIGLVSLMIWVLTIVVTIKYILLLLRADNDGEGGILSLLALLLKKIPKRSTVLIALGLAGSALFIGDSMVTPALSVLSAVEGVRYIAPELDNFIILIALGILVLLFMLQSHGTKGVACFFSPIMVAWLLMITVSGLIHISDDWGILAAFNPMYALHMVFGKGTISLVVLGSVFLTITGAEALYADLGHFGRKPIQYAWMVIFPALAINYLGQGALVLSNPEAIKDPFYMMFGGWFLPFAVLTATCATVIASQAVITGTFSLARQAIHLGFLPRMKIFFTSETFKGQVFLPSINLFLFVGVLLFVIGFRHSESLVAAYGISVSGTMVISTIMFSVFVHVCWKWKISKVIIFLFPLLSIEMTFLGANLFKVLDGGYTPLLIASLCIIVMWTWRRGTNLLSTLTRHADIPIHSFIISIENSSQQVPGTAIFLTSDSQAVPDALLQNIKHNRILHEQNIILTINTANQPRIPKEKRFVCEKISEHFSRVELFFGYMEEQNVSQALAELRNNGLKFEIMNTSFYLGRRKLVPTSRAGMPNWQDHLFIMLSTYAEDPSDYFHLPANRVVEIVSHVNI
ncbi:potassium transporter Kup [Candidatus Liberibacter asiaticus]|uniref:Probable potassium transport system protein Kup n=6 Tax=Liberibacter asiaticus TaxID=34021 RepID=C6XG02_LIBAP|nr:potassium transporter Kup [Candidatus Liberibacter asiaticus]ACT57305.1 putative potassium uptake transport system protein [Candidatus Liberibacter asiaticus str. psy62]AGH17071.1 putative potassium uptake transport system protein [Candidatus Liberibacter asiaticus str. gxpsy]ALK07394.1 potassium transporter Kup [Candidatus Liberibacter asiaticus]ASK52885.1 potassium transporter Kup [Candidatus Liberibacter asiaticus]AWL14203.1 potassium transporter Kup [Candidatus Liberibacter asiaticus]